MKYINTRFLLQSLLMLLLIGAIVFVLFLSSARKKATLDALSKTSEIYAEIEKLNNNMAKAFTIQITDADFANFGCDKLINDQTSKINVIIDSVESLKEFGFLKKPFNKTLLADSVVIALKNYNRSFELALLSLKEKGNRFGGRLGILYKLNKDLLKELHAAPDRDSMASQLTQISDNYFTSLENSRLVSYKDFCETIVSYFFDNYPSFDVSEIDGLATQIIREISAVKQIDDRISIDNQDKGQYTDVVKSYSTLNYYNNSQLKFVKLQCREYYRWWNIVFIIITLLVAVIYMKTGQKFSGNISNRIKSLVKKSSQLKEGDFETSIEIESYCEFETIFANLDGLRLNLKERTDFIDKLLVNDFNPKLELQGKYDELTKKLLKLREKLYIAQQEQEKRDKDNEIRRYINEGLAKFSDIMRVNSNNTIALGDSLIKELVRYLGALQGGMFLIDETNSDLLNLISAFAYDRKKYLTKTIRIGDGLVGTCAIEKKKIYLTQVPKDYILIKSGLGDTPPDNVLIVPVIHEDYILGVIEIASLKKLAEYEIELAEQIASSLATTLITVRNNTKTAELLEKSQHQAAEMAEQEEEMRQNMEELKATQEESARREEEMQGILDAIGTSFYIIEYNTDGSIIHLNERMSIFLNEPYEALIGKKHTDVFSTASELNNNLFGKITADKESKKITETLNWGSKLYRYNHNLSAILSKYGEVTKILNIMTIEEVKEKEKKDK